MHNAFKISAVLHGECESQRFLVQGCTGLKSIVHSFGPNGLSCSRERWLRVTELSKWGAAYKKGLLYTSSLHEIHQIKETLLVVPLLGRTIDSLDSKVLIVVAELPIVSKAPSERSQHLHAIFPDRL